MSIYFLDLESSDAAYFESAFPGEDLRLAHSPQEVGADARVMSLFIRTRVDAAFLDAHPALRLIATRSTGVDHLDLATCRERGVAVANVPSYGENTVAEHAFALILSLSRRLREVVTDLSKPRQFSYETVRGFDLKGKTMGVIGAGRIGLHMVRLARAFGMKVLAFDPVAQSFLSDLLDFEYTSLDRLLAKSHIISLHTALHESTHHLLNRETLARCRRGVLIINTARGGLVDTEALLEALESGQVGGAGLDVLEDESVLQQEAAKIITSQIIDRLKAVTSTSEVHEQDPARVKELEGLLRNKTLLARPDVVFTPHVAFNSVEAVERINAVTAENIRAFLRGEPINLVG